MEWVPTLYKLPNFLSTKWAIHLTKLANLSLDLLRYFLVPIQFSAGKQSRVSHSMPSSRTWLALSSLHVLRPTSILLKIELCASKFISRWTVDLNLHMCQMLKLLPMLQVIWLLWWNRGEDGWMARFSEQKKWFQTSSIWSAVREQTMEFSRRLV